MPGLGIAAGLGTACAWGVSVVINTAAARLIGVHAFMMLRLPLAALVLIPFCLVAGQFQPYTPYALFIGIASGVLGLVVCDWCLYEAVLRIGIRTAMVCHSLYTCVTALLGVVFFSDHLGIQGFCGIGVATLGVIMVTIAERQHAEPSLAALSPSRQRQGVALALFSAVAIAIGLIFSKAAIQDGMPPLMLTLLRNAAGAFLLLGTGICLRRIQSTAAKVRAAPSVIKLLLIGCVFGPVGGIWLSLVALEHAPTAVASTLIGLQPVALLLISGIHERRCPSLGSILGACTACAGTAILLLR
jgi:drug/metabolite transporter (DMT)-like permease